jgi:predicted nucleic acid-binding protein
MDWLPQMDLWLQDLSPYLRASLDTNVVIYALEDVEPFKELTQHLLERMEQGVMTGTVSTVVEAELLVKPLRERDRLALNRAELFFTNSPNLVIRALDRTIAARAAMVKATSPLSLPDAVVVATAVGEGCDVLIGNDAAMMKHRFGVPYLYLNDYVS